MLRSFVVGTAIFAYVALAGSAAAQIQESGQQACLNKSSGSARKVATSTIKNAVDCLKKGSTADLPMGMTAQACLTADLKGKVGKARTKTSGAVTKSCGAVPDFGFTSDATLNNSHEDEAVGFIPDLFGDDLDAALAGPLLPDEKARCTSGVVGQSVKVADAMLKVFLGCMKDGLREGVIVDDASLQACLNEIVVDARGRVSKAVARVETKLAPSLCTATPGDYLPEIDGADELCDRYGIALPLNASTAATCLANRMRCRVCRMLNQSHDLAQNCDLFDDGSVDGTCPECPNGSTDAGEECDDGNFTNGDGCTSECILEVCGDGVQNNAGQEECDDGLANSDTTPNACRLDCTEPVCGDAVADDQYDEECDDGGESEACDADCTFSDCGDGVINQQAGEICDDANENNNDGCVGCQLATCGDGFVRTGIEQCDGSECCSDLCVYDLPGTACEGTEDICTSPQCNGSGVCLESPANEGDPCDDGTECTVASSCQSGSCTADEWSGVGLACEWVVVGAAANNTVMEANDNAVSVGGNWCALHAEFDVGTVISGDIIASHYDNPNPGRAILFGDQVEVDGGDIVTDNFSVETPLASGYDLPGLTNISTVAAGQFVSKTPAPTFYDTTGTDPRIDDCEAAQADLLNASTILDALPSTSNLGSAYQDLPSGAAAPINAVNVGGLNVFDMTHLNGTNTNVTITLNGGGNANTVFVLRISQRLNSGSNWTFNLTGGLTYDHLLFYVSKNGGDENCAIGLFNVGGGTIFCPDVKLNINANSQWTGAAYGGASGINGQVRIGQSVTLTYDPFIGDVTP
jgi:cysteine-rich repeat protein